MTQIAGLPSGLNFRSPAGPISKSELRDVEVALRQLPQHDLELVGSQGVDVNLYPFPSFQGNLLGLTRSKRETSTSPYIPYEINVAVRAARTGSESTGEIMQHEFGHAVEILRRQDFSEDAAIRYAASH